MCNKVSFFQRPIKYILWVFVFFFQTYKGSNQLPYVAYIKLTYWLFVIILICFRSLNLIYSERISISENVLTKNGREEVPSREIFVVTTYRALRLCSTPEFVVSKNK